MGEHFSWGQAEADQPTQGLTGNDSYLNLDLKSHSPLL